MRRVIKKEGALEKDIQYAICDYLQMRRYFFWRQNTNPIFDKKTGVVRKMPKYSKTGVPDIILVRNGIFIGIEVKQKKGKQSENQVKFENGLTQAGGEYHLVTSLDDIKALGL